jgi:hypothetical protein
MSVKLFQELSQGRVTQRKGEHFSYRHIPTGESALIPEEQQMIVDRVIEIDGALLVDGELLLEDFKEVVIPTPPVFTQVDQFSYKLIGAGETVTIPADQEMFLADRIDIDGTLIVDGHLAVGEGVPPVEPIVIPGDNFSYTEVQLAQVINIPVRQQMVVDGMMTVDGVLEIDGELAFLPAPPEPEEDEFLPWYEIPSGKVISIKQYREYFLSEYLLLDGEIQIDGRLVIGA